MRPENCKVCQNETITVEVVIHFGSEVRIYGYCNVIHMVDDFTSEKKSSK